MRYMQTANMSIILYNTMNPTVLKSVEGVKSLVKYFMLFCMPLI